MSGASIRLAGQADAAAIAAIYAPHVASSAASFETTPPSTQDVATRIAETAEMYPWLVCDWMALACERLDVVNKTRSNIFGWRGQLTTEFAERDLREAVNRIFSDQSL